METKTTELTDVSGTVPVFEGVDDDSRIAYVTLTIDSDKLTPAQFVAALERLRQDVDPAAKVVWDFASTTRPVLAYEDGDVQVRVTGPRLPNREPALPDPELTLRGEAARTPESAAVQEAARHGE